MFLRFMFRCGRCRQVTTQNVQWVNRAPAKIRCGGCGSSYAIPFDEKRDPSEPTYRDEIRRLASQYHLDPATACSVHEGIMSLQQATSPAHHSSSRGASPRGASPRRTSPRGTSLRGTNLRGTDLSPMRRPSLAWGLLLLAIVLGSSLLMRRTGLAAPMVVTPQPDHYEAPTRPPEEPEVPPVLQPIVSRADANGLLTQVWGPDPRSVLLAICEHPQYMSRVQPVYLAPGRPPGPAVRLGLVRDLADTDLLEAVKIRRDGRTGRWYAGNGRDPIVMESYKPITVAGMDPI